MGQQQCVDFEVSPFKTRPPFRSECSVWCRYGEDCLVKGLWNQKQRLQSIRSTLLFPGRTLSATVTFLLVSLLLVPASSRRISAHHYNQQLRTRNIQETDYGAVLRVRIPEFSVLIQPTPIALSSTQAEDVRYYSEFIISDYVMNATHWAVEGSSLAPQFFKTSSVSEVRFAEGDGSDIPPSSEVVIRGAVLSFDTSADTDSLYLPSQTEFQSTMSNLLFPPNNISSGLIAKLHQVGGFDDVTDGDFYGQQESTSPNAAVPTASTTVIPSRNPTLAPIVANTANEELSVAPTSSNPTLAPIVSKTRNEELSVAPTSSNPTSVPIVTNTANEELSVAPTSSNPTSAPIVSKTRNELSVSPTSSHEPAAAPSTLPTKAIDNTITADSEIPADDEITAGNGQSINNANDADISPSSSTSFSAGGGKGVLIGGAAAGLAIVGIVSWLFVKRRKSDKKIKDDTVNMNGAKVKELRDLDDLGTLDLAECEEDTEDITKIAPDLTTSNVQDDLNGSSEFFDSSKLLWEADDLNVMKLGEGMEAYALSNDGEIMKVSFDDIPAICDSDSDRQNITMPDRLVDSFESQANRMTFVRRKETLNQPPGQLTHEDELKEKKKKGRLDSSYFFAPENTGTNSRNSECNNNPYPYQDRRKRPHANYPANMLLENAIVSSHSDFINIEFEPDINWDPSDNEADPVLVATSLDTSFAHATNGPNLHT